MRYTKSADGNMRTSVQVIIRLRPEEVALIRKELRERGEPVNDTTIKEFVRALTEYHPFNHMAPDSDWKEICDIG